MKKQGVEGRWACFGKREVAVGRKNSNMDVHV